MATNITGPVARMSLGKKQEEIKTDAVVEETIAEEVSAGSAATVGTEEIAEEELLKDLDLEKFYLTGRVEYEFKLNGKMPIKFRMLSSEELVKVNQFLFNCSKEDIAMSVVMTEHSINIMKDALLVYGETQLASLSEEKRVEFVRSIPSIILPLLTRKYSVFESSVGKLLSDGEQLKNS